MRFFSSQISSCFFFYRLDHIGLSLQGTEFLNFQFVTAYWVNAVVKGNTMMPENFYFNQKKWQCDRAKARYAQG